jgi:hypothetical protein
VAPALVAPAPPATQAGPAGLDRRAGPLARTGSSVRWEQFWGGVALAFGGLMVFWGRDGTAGRRQEPDGA